MSATAVVVGARIVLDQVRRGSGCARGAKVGPLGTVEFVGRCGHPPCKHGDRCAVVRWDGAATTMNYNADELVFAVQS